MENGLPSAELAVGVQHRFTGIVEIEAHFVAARVLAYNGGDAGYLHGGGVPYLVVANSKVQIFYILAEKERKLAVLAGDKDQPIMIEFEIGVGIEIVDVRSSLRGAL